jgi:FAD/FMN-containing dehydrogenase
MPAATAIVNDVTRLNPVPVWAITKPASVADVQDAMRRTEVPISVGGGHFSMGGQTASPDSLHMDLRGLNRVLAFWPDEQRIRVQAGIRWCDIQKFVDPHGLSVKIMQTYANFTVGGSLSVNVHGRYIGLGPVILSVRSIALVLPDGQLKEASPTQDSELFYGAIGGYGALGIIVEAVLDLARNTRVERIATKLPLDLYCTHFREQVRDSRMAVFHNADLYAPEYARVRAVTGRKPSGPSRSPTGCNRIGAPIHCIDIFYGRSRRRLSASGGANFLSIRWSISASRCIGATTRRATMSRSWSPIRANGAPMSCRNTSCRSSGSKHSSH